MSDYPYPKLRKDLDDYTASLFNCDMTATESGLSIIVRGKFELLDDGIEELIEEGNAEYCLLIQCDATKTNKCIPVKMEEKQFMYKLTKVEYTGEVEITPGVIMLQEIKGYSNDGLNPDYDDAFIVLPRGALIAEAEKSVIKLFRESTLPGGSICDFVIGKDFNYSETGDKIAISVPREIFECSNALRSLECSQIFTSMYVFPVIQDIIQRYWFDSPESFSNRWFITLQDMITTLYPDGIEKTTAYGIATELLQEMLFESSRYLVKHYGDNYEC